MVWLAFLRLDSTSSLTAFICVANWMADSFLASLLRLVPMLGWYPYMAMKGECPVDDWNLLLYVNSAMDNHSAQSLWW